MRFGPTFADELQAAGLAGLPFSWGEDGVFYSKQITSRQRQDIEAVLAAHDPTARPVDPRIARMAQIDGANDLTSLKTVLKTLL